MWFGLLITITDHEIASKITKSCNLILENTLVDLKLKMANVQIDLAVNLWELKFYILRAFIRRNLKSNARLNGVKYRS